MLKAVILMYYFYFRGLGQGYPLPAPTPQASSGEGVGGTEVCAYKKFLYLYGLDCSFIAGSPLLFGLPSVWVYTPEIGI